MFGGAKHEPRHVEVWRFGLASRCTISLKWENDTYGKSIFLLIVGLIDALTSLYIIWLILVRVGLAGLIVNFRLDHEDLESLVKSYSLKTKLPDR